MATGGSDGGRVEVEIDATVNALDQIEHIVVLMMENRSFDHMLGYLRLSGRRPELDGLQAGMANVYHDRSGKFPRYDGLSFGVHELPVTQLTKAQDPPHGGSSVDKQLKNKNGGFVQTYMDERGGPAEVHPGDVMGYHTERHLPVYDHLSEKFCICDRWYSSVAGSTLPNRLYAMAGRAAGKRDNDSPPIYHLPSFVRHLDNLKGVSWSMFVHDLTPILWAVDNDYPFENLINEHVAWFDGHFRPPYFGDTFIQRAAAGKLPSVSWIDPSFADLRTGLMRIISPPSNDDHPPSDVTLGQALVLKIYDALASSPNWAKTLFVITYDEHGGFFDHVPPPLNPPDDNPTVFKRYGVRVPAIVVSPLVGRRSFSHETFDHTSIIKTILLRFARTQNTIPDMGKRVTNANHLGALLTEAQPRPAETAELYRPLATKIDTNRQDTTHQHLTLGANTRAAAQTQPTDLQHDYLTIQTAFAKQLLKQAPEKLTKFLQ
ncbi:MAG: alkaline phosphatase family protein [Solirubrobacteraceae bacterium]